MSIDRKIKVLSEDFYINFDDNLHYAEILRKEDRPYCILVIQVDKVKFAIPFRTNINHNHSYIFKDSNRGSKSGLDFTKAVVITDDKYIGNETVIDSKEYREFINKINVIENRFLKFIKNYKKWIENPSYHRAENTMKYSSLQYFHKELGII